MSGLLQNTLELYLTPGSCPNQKFIGWNLQPSLSKPGGWRLEEEGSRESQTRYSKPHPNPIVFVGTLFIRIVLLAPFLMMKQFL